MWIYRRMIFPKDFIRKIDYEELPRFLYRLTYEHNLKKIVDVLAILFGYSTLIPLSPDAEKNRSLFLVGKRLPYQGLNISQENGCLLFLQPPPKILEDEKIDFNEFRKFCGESPEPGGFHRYIEMMVEEKQRNLE